MSNSPSFSDHTELETLTNAPGIGPSTLDYFRDAGFESADEVGLYTPEELSENVKGVGYSTAISVLKYLEREGLRDTSKRDRDLEKLIELLQDLFEFNHQDRDFGVYKLMNANRDEIEEYIKEDLVEKIEDEVADLQDQFGENSTGEAVDVVNELGDEAFDDDGLSETAEQMIQKQTAGASERELENVRSDIYNHIYRFFSNYYEDGDFINRRKRSQHSEPYSVPYDGSNTHFHWVTKGQYYAKNSEHITRFTFNQGGFKFLFELQDGELYDTHSGSNKSEYFIMGETDQIEVDQSQETVRVPFYRQTVDDDELLQRCDVNQNNAAAFKKTFVTEAFETINTEEVPVNEEALEEKFDEYLQKSQNDFFIHKDTESFLMNELEEYIKTQVISFDPKSGTDSITKIAAEKGRVVNEIATDVISFVSQIEEFKKKVFEKEKFVLGRTELRQVDEVDSQHYGAILQNSEQIEEWEDSYGIDSSSIDQQDLENPPYNQMMVNTEHFDNFLTPTEEPENKLIKADNYQALSFLQERYSNSLKCIYIDPPYNTGNANFAYKDKYQRPTWLSMMDERLKLARELLEEEGVVFISIDQHEKHNLRNLCDEIFGEENLLQELVWDLNSGFNRGHFKRSHEYILAYCKDRTKLPHFNLSDSISVLRDFDSKFIRHNAVKSVDKNGRFSTISFSKGDVQYEGGDAEFKEGENIGSEREPLTVVDGPAVFEGGVLKSDIKLEANWAMRNQMLDWLENGVTYDSKGQKVNRFYIPASGGMKYEKIRDGINPKSVLKGFPSRGRDELEAIFGEAVYDYPKPSVLIKELLALVTEEGDTVLDFFAGSGTTGQAVQELNRERDETINYILVEMLEEAFDITEERVRRVAYSSEWVDGEAQVDEESTLLQNAGVECLELETYEQALDAIQFKKDQNTLSSYNEFLLNYMLEFGTESSPVFLDTDQLTQPTEYKLDLNLDSQSVDVMTTFNYLLGLDELRRQRREIGGVAYTMYSGTVDGDSVLVVWRHNAEAVDFEEEATEINLGQYDRVYINGDSILEESTPISDKFSRKMTNEGDSL